MSSTYSSSLRVELIGSGDQAGTWGTTTDNNFAYIFDTAIAGINTVTISSVNQALTYVNGPTSTAALNQSIYAILKLNSAAAASAIYAPPVSKQYIIWNNSSYTITIYNSTVIGNTTAAGTGVAILTGNKVMVWSDGTNFYEVQAQNLTGTLAIINGGTGQTTANAAFNALAPAQTNNRLLRSDGTNTSFAQAVLTTDVTGTLPVANGGTAATTAATARTNLGLVIGTDVPSPTGTGASGTWSINVTGNAATATSATSATSATTAGNVSGTVAVANGGTGATSAAGARSNLGLVIGTDVLSPSGSAASLTSFPTLNQNTTGSSGSCTGNAATATNVAYSGLTGAVPTWNQNTTGNAATATNVAYSGLTGAVPTWNQNTTGSSGSCTGNAATATKRGVLGSYRRCADVESNTTGSSGSCTGNAATATNVAYSGLTGAVPTWDQNTTGNAATATNVAYSGLTGAVPTWNQNTTGSSGSCTGNAATATALSTASGSAPSYSARAWVNFNGTGTVAIRSSANVSSITDNGVGDYTVNFTTAMSDANYAFAGIASPASDSNSYLTMPVGGTYTTSALQVLSRGATNLAVQDASIVTIIVLS